MSVYLGTATPTDFKLGATAVSKLYLGTTQVWPTGGGTPAPTDSYYNQVALLLHGEAASDSSRYNRAIATTSAYGTTPVSISSVQKKFGTGSFYFPPRDSGQSQSYSHTTINTTGKGFDVYGDFVLEWWQYLSNVTDQAYIFSSGTTNGQGTDSFGQDWNWSAGTIRAVGFNNSSLISHGGSLIANQWQYIAISRAGQTIRLYVDGALKGSTTNEFALLSNATTARIGGAAFLRAIENGYIDELRLTNGINRGYIGSSIPVPTAPFPDAQATGAFAVILTSGTSFTVPSGYTSMKAWAIGQGSKNGGLPGSAGGVAYKTWSVTGGSTVSYAVGNSFADAGANTTVTYSGSTISGNGASVFGAGGSYSGGDGGANGGGPYNSGDDYTGGAIGGTAATSIGSGLRRPATNVSGLFVAITLAGGVSAESGASAAIGSGGWLNGKDGSALGAGYGGGRSTNATETPGAVVLSFS